MKKKKNKVKFFGWKDKFARRRTLLVLGIILIIIVFNLICSLFSKEKTPEKISFLLDNKLIELKNDAFIDEDNVIYISKADVEKIFDSTIYYNEAEKELITTYNKHIALLKVDETFMVVNDSNVELKSPMIEKNKKVYLPFSEMGIVYDLEFSYSENSKYFIADSLSKSKKQALSLKDFKLKERTGAFSKGLEKINQGEYLTVIKEEGKYIKARSTDGTIGYVKAKKLSDVEKIRDNWDVEEINVEVIQSASDMSKNYTNAKLSNDKQNVAIPTFFYIDKDSKVLDKTLSQSEDYNNYMNWTKENNIEVWATLTNNAEVSNCLLTYNSRNSVINELYYRIVEHEFSGVNINFEKIDDVNSFYRFIIELTPRLKELGIKVAVTYNKNLDKEKIKNIVDIVIE